MSQSSETSRPVARSQPLTHDPLKPHLAGMPEHHIALQVLELMGLTLPRYAAFRRGSFAYPRPEHRSGRDDRRWGRERASFGRLGRQGREPKSTSSAAAAAQLPRPTRRVGQDEGAPASLGEREGRGPWSPDGCGESSGVQRHPAPNQCRKQRAVPAAALRQPQSSLSLSASLRFRLGTLGSGQGGAETTQPPGSAPLQPKT